MPPNDPLDHHRDPSSLRGTRLCVQSAPEWVIRRKVKNSSRQDNHPITMLLLDRQVYPDEAARYTRYVRRLETPQAVQDAGRIELDFDPATQKLLIHSISIFRQGELTNLAKLEDIDIIQRERDLDQGIYAGSITALILLKDVRTGDIIDIESSIVSDDAIFPNHYWLMEYLEHTIPVAQQHFSWLSKEHEKFETRITAKHITEAEEETSWGMRKTWSAGENAAIELEPSLPIGFNPFAHISLTSYSSWQQVASDIADLWSEKEEPGQLLPQELAKIRAAHTGDEKALIQACVAFVRDNIRYQGIEMGRLGLVPEKLDKIWERRYGDCKEKTSVLCWLLRNCGFDACPALVSTTMRSYVSEQLPAPVFDHVLVHLCYQDTDYWIDPTNIAQRGCLAHWTSVPFQKAFLISHQTTGFKDIAGPPAGLDVVKVMEDYDFSDGTNASIDVRHDYLGGEADGVRHVLDSTGRNSIQQIFTDIVKSTRSQAEIETDMTVDDDPEKNKVTLRAKFFAKDILKRDPQRASYGCEFVPHSIVGKIVGLDEKRRKHPLGLIHPVEIEHVTKVGHPQAKGAIVPKTVINNEYLSFECGTRNENKNPELYYKLRTKASEIPVKDLSRYRLNLDQIGSAISMFFECTNVGSPKRGSRHNVAASAKPRWDEGEYDHPQPRRRSRQMHTHQPQSSGAGFPLWPVLMGVFILIKIIIYFAING